MYFYLTYDPEQFEPPNEYQVQDIKT
jgi:hypothetical protein